MNYFDTFAQEVAWTTVRILLILSVLEGLDTEQVGYTYSDLDSRWELKCKRYPYGTIRRFKARFCCRGDQQALVILF